MSRKRSDRLWGGDKSILGGIDISSSQTQPHTPDYHAARTHSREWDPPLLTLDGSTRTKVGTDPDAFSVITLPNGSSTGVSFSWVVPQDYISGPGQEFYMVWTPSANDAVSHSVVWQMDAKIRTAGDDVTTAGATTSYTGTARVNTQNNLVVDGPLMPSGGGSTQPGDFIRLNLRRLGGDAADTAVLDVNLILVQIRWTGAF